MISNNIPVFSDLMVSSVTCTSVFLVLKWVIHSPKKFSLLNWMLYFPTVTLWLSVVCVVTCPEHFKVFSSKSILT